MKFGQGLGLLATAAAALLLWSLRHVVIQLFAAVVLAMALFAHLRRRPLLTNRRALLNFPAPAI
jgi:hypothetical protein